MPLKVQIMEVDSSDSSSEEDSKRKKSKKDKHKKKHHKSKEKKQKKSKKHRRRSSSSDGSSEEETWVEAGAGKTLKADNDKPPPAKKLISDPSNGSSSRIQIPKSKLEDDDEWASFGNVLPTYSNDSKRNQRKKQKEDERNTKSIDKVGQHEKELNPYWKDGGIGLPAQEDSKPKPIHSVGDGGLGWLKKSFQRAKEQAKDEGKSLEEVVSERWGSLEAFYSLLEEAERKAKGDSPSSSRRDRDRDDRRHKSFKRPDRDSGSEDDNSKYRYHSNSRSKRSPEPQSRYSKEYYSSRRERKRDKNPSWMKPGAANKSSRSPTEGTSRRKKDVESYETSSSNSIKAEKNIRDARNPKIEAAVVQSDSDAEEIPVSEVETPKVLTDKEMNELNAKILKAEMFGNEELLLSLREQLKNAETARQEFIKGGGKITDEKTKVITKIIVGSQNTGRRKKDKPTETHKDGQRVRYFPDDDKYTLKTMFEREKLNTTEDENALFCRLAAKGSKASGDYDADEIFVDKASSSRQETKEKEREVRKALDDEKEYKKVIDDCQWCFDGKYLEKNLVVSIAKSTFLCVPPYQSLTEGHCLIVPMFHVSAATQLDEDVWTEMQRFRKALVKMFRDRDQDCVFFETAVFLKKQPHMYLECVPMPKETGELAPIYFKKAIQECETEWAQNKKVVDLRNRDVRKAVPQGLPYFSVEFADDNCGFAHVIEEEKNFPKNFAQEIVGGMLELDHQIWRKQKRDDFNKQRTKLMSFLKAWAPYDWTREDSSNIVAGTEDAD